MRARCLKLLFEKHDDIAVVTFNRPERRNAITPEMIVRLYDAWIAFREDERRHRGGECTRGDAVG